MGTVNDVIYLDYSTLSTFNTCREKARLSYVEHLSPIAEVPPLAFGSAFHEGIAEFYRHLPFVSRPDALQHGKLGFVNELKKRDSHLPLALESEERRSIERGIALLEAYVERWKGEIYEAVLRPDTNEPYVEIGFSIYLMDWHGVPVIYVGRLDSIRRNRVDGQLYNFELKTTTRGLSQFIKQVRPNHQITGYHLAVRELLKQKVVGTVWDAVFVSDRKPDVKGDQWKQSGIDIEKDFARQETRRSDVDIDEFLFDITSMATEFLRLRDDKLKRWIRSAPTACHMYGGCQFRDLCSTNLNEAFKKSKFKIEIWKPWELPGVTK